MRAVFVLSFVWIIGSCYASEPTEFYFYINADNDIIGVDEQLQLFHHGEKTFDTIIELAKTSSESVGFHIYIDPNSLVSRGETTTRIVRYCNGVKVETISRIESDSSDPQNLSELLGSSCFEKSSKQLIFWGHGNPWENIVSYDHSHKASSFNYSNFASSIVGIDSLVFDACAMGAIETVANFRKSAKYIIASQFDLPAHGIQYDGLKEYLSGERNSDNLYRLLRAESSRKNRIEGTFAPLVRFSTEKYDEVAKDVSDLISELDLLRDKVAWEQIAKKSAFYNNLAFRLIGATDLRKFVYFLMRSEIISEERAKVSVQKLNSMLHDSYGSIFFFLPESYEESFSASRIEQIEPNLSNQFLENLYNWQLIKSWSKYEN